MSVSLARPWLSFDLGSDHRVLSWSLTRPGFVTARKILWREVRNADLPRDFTSSRARYSAGAISFASLTSSP